MIHHCDLYETYFKVRVKTERHPRVSCVRRCPRAAVGGSAGSVKLLFNENLIPGWSIYSSLSFLPANMLILRECVAAQIVVSGDTSKIMGSGSFQRTTTSGSSPFCMDCLPKVYGVLSQRNPTPLIMPPPAPRRGSSDRKPEASHSCVEPPTGHQCPLTPVMPI